MIKSARKPSADPVQERLRQNKAAWNKDVSAFINDLIHLKKTMNGWPSKFFKERSKIVQPIPADPTTILGALAGDFQELAQRGNTIVQEQLDYSKNRRQTQPKAPAAPGATTPAPTPEAAPPPPAGAPAGSDLTKQLAASFQEKYDLVSEASNPFSRFIAKMRTPQIGFGAGAQVRRLRMDMLKSAVRSYKDLGKLQVEITKSSKDSIQVAHKLMQHSWNEWSLVSRNFNNYVNSLPEQTTPRQEDMKDEGPTPEKEEADLVKQVVPSRDPDILDPNRASEITSDYHNYGGVFYGRDGGLLNRLGKIKYHTVNFEGNEVITGGPIAMEIVYKQLLDYLNKSLGTSGSSLKQINEQEKSKPVVSEYPPLKGSDMPKAASAQLEVVAQAFLKKWLGKTRHQLLPGRSSGIRLQVYELAAKTRKNINEVMDLLEKNLSPETLGVKISAVSYQMNMLRSLMRSLSFTEKPVKGQESSVLGF